MQEEERAPQKMRIRRISAVLLCALSAGLAIGSPIAAAYREPLVQEPGGPEEWLDVGQLPPLQTEEQIEGACGLAIRSATHNLFVSDYYHRAVHTYTVSGIYQGSEFLTGGNPPPVLEPVNELNS